MSSSSHTATLASTMVYNYKTVIEPVSGRGLSNGPFISITFTFIKPFTRSFTLAASYSNILSMRTSLARRRRLTSYGHTSRISARICI
jgi:hypothetical protein